MDYTNTNSKDEQKNYQSQNYDIQNHEAVNSQQRQVRVNQDINQDINQDVNQNVNRDLNQDLNQAHGINHNTYTRDNISESKQKNKRVFSSINESVNSIRQSYHEESEEVFSVIKFSISFALSLFFGILFFNTFKYFFNSPLDLISLDYFQFLLIHFKTLLFSLIFFSLFLVNYTLMFFLSKNFIHKIIALIPVFLVSFFFVIHNSIGLSFGLSLIAVAVVSTLYPPIKIFKDHFTTVSSLQHFSSSMLSKILPLMFFIFIIFSFATSTYYTKQAVNVMMSDMNSSLENAMMNSSSVKAMIAQALSKQTGFNVSQNEVSPQVVSLAEKGMNDAFSGFKEKALSFIYKIPYINQIIVIGVAGLIYFYFSILFALTRFLNFLFNLGFVLLAR